MQVAEPPLDLLQAIAGVDSRVANHQLRTQASELAAILREKQRVLEKRQIGLAAAALVTDGETIAIGAGTTTTQVARSIRHRRGLTVVTNAINIAMELSHQDDLKVMVTGGWVSGSWFALVGPGAIHTAGEIFVDKAFIGVDGIHPEHGLTTNYPDQAAIHRAMMHQARQRIVVADHRKVGIVGTTRIWPATDLDILITDKTTTDELIAAFAAKNIRVLRGVELGHGARQVFVLHDLEGYNKFVPYYLHPECVYSVGLSKSSFRTKVSVGSNPWAKAENMVNLAAICERYGGGGHARVGAISFEPGRLEEARGIFAETIQDFHKDAYTAGIVFTLEGIAAFLIVTGKPEKAARLIGCADATRERIRDIRPLIEEADMYRNMAAILSKIGGKALTSFGQKTLMAPAAEGAGTLSRWLRPSMPITPASLGTFAAEATGSILPFVGAEHFMSVTDNDTGPVYAAMQTPMPFARQQNADLQGVYSEQQLLALQDALDRLGIGGLV